MFHSSCTMNPSFCFFSHSQICTEILCVLQHARVADTHQGCAPDLRHICAQTVFSLLDHLTKWTRHRIKTLSAQSVSSRGGRSTSVSGMSSLWVHVKILLPF